MELFVISPASVLALSILIHIATGKISLIIEGIVAILNGLIWLFVSSIICRWVFAIAGGNPSTGEFATWGQAFFTLLIPASAIASIFLGTLAFKKASKVDTSLFGRQGC